MEQMLRAGVDTCFIKSCLAWILKLKDKRNGGGREGLDRRNKITCLPAFLCAVQKNP